MSCLSFFMCVAIWFSFHWFKNRSRPREKPRTRRNIALFAALNLRHFGQKLGANAGRSRLVLSAKRRLPRVVAIGRRADQGGRLVIIDRPSPWRP
jgi:hypothetical protein